MIDLDEANLSSFTAGPGLRFVMFGGHGCRPSNEQRAALEALGWGPLAPKLGAIDVLVHDGARQLMHIRQLPTTIVFHDGEIAHRLTGFQSRQRLEAIAARLVRDTSSFALAA